MTSRRADRIDDLIHAPVRLAALALLDEVGQVDFVDLRAHLDVSPGNLSAHLVKLETAGYLTLEKQFLDRKPRTQARLTPKGRHAYHAYLVTLAELVGRRWAEPATGSSPSAHGPEPDPVSADRCPH